MKKIENHFQNSKNYVRKVSFILYISFRCMQNRLCFLNYFFIINMLQSICFCYVHNNQLMNEIINSTSFELTYTNDGIQDKLMKVYMYATKYSSLYYMTKHFSSKSPSFSMFQVNPYRLEILLFLKHQSK